MGRKSVEESWLDQPLDRKQLIDYMRKFKVIPYWTRNRGLVFRPYLSSDMREKSRKILHIYGKDDVERVKAELTVSSTGEREGEIEDEGPTENKTKLNMRSRKRPRHADANEVPITNQHLFRNLICKWLPVVLRTRS